MIFLETQSIIAVIVGMAILVAMIGGRSGFKKDKIPYWLLLFLFIFAFLMLTDNIFQAADLHQHKKEAVDEQ